ncbi:MAG: hypothetical protein A2359_01630 [Candidatus Moranbacteria bacterium RIFOXYB1_FULL_43_19]|nr:MAG: hypothetical protein A2359_01630 [Candidatus Moranbacteria bacterium RIFOXYB1_FULL_43_19]OGI27565.1 MAG: hypothetical protein A2184_00345 [Candidatus Moranbacteria bacterium RIFOXYA1_FULL_44_7]OGI32628.1 MAG: hypothetical protein A2420_01350 [Candidatus Moranbacteria bacterium RIFOXYC1_FULL_44_13]OGI37861.1 MAG: hypothetical protein A2612_05570 [Candidatus Moranbacteria bacterium RIFOXYD1_FULL_44_12]
MKENRIILEIKEKSGRSFIFLENRASRNGKRKKEALGKKDISLELLPAIDRLVRKNKLHRKHGRQNRRGIDKISGYRIISDVPNNWTSVRIARITFEVLRLAER